MNRWRQRRGGTRGRGPHRGARSGGPWPPPTLPVPGEGGREPPLLHWCLVLLVIVVVIHVVVVAATPLRFFKFFAALARLSAVLAVTLHRVAQLILRLVKDA